VLGQIDFDATHTELVRTTWELERDDLDFLERRALLLFAEEFRSTDEIRTQLRDLLAS
jgi:hypothetical protein